MHANITAHLTAMLRRLQAEQADLYAASERDRHDPSARSRAHVIQLQRALEREHKRIAELQDMLLDPEFMSTWQSNYDAST